MTVDSIVKKAMKKLDLTGFESAEELTDTLEYLKRSIEHLCTEALNSLEI
jgi:hypothetical protein